MAAKKRASGGFSTGQKVHRASAQTKVKLSQAAKKRQRIHGRFQKQKFGADYEGPHNRAVKGTRGKGVLPEAKPPKGQTRGGNPEFGSQSRATGMTETEYKSQVRQSVDRWKAKGLGDADARLAAVNEIGQRTGRKPDYLDFGDRTYRSSSSDRATLNQSMRKEGWKKGHDLYTSRYATTGQKKDALNITEMMNQLAPEHRATVEGLLSDPGSAFNRGLNQERPTTGTSRMKPGNRRRLDQYSLNLQKGMSHEEAYSAISEARQGPSGIASKQAVRRLGTREPVVPTRTSKFQSQVTKETGKGFGVDIPGTTSLEKLGKINPGASTRHLVQAQQGQRQASYDDFLKNNKWAHETKRSNITGGKGDVSAKNKVTFFTTSLGSPNATVPADSLVGQYIIRKRKNFLKNEGFNDRDLAGAYPNAVRDMHIVEAGAGRSLGVEGRAGVYKQGGWRAGSKRSKGFGKAAPVGAQVLTDSTGRPIYDEAGNVVYSEGATRPFSVGTKRQLGLRVFLG